MVFWDTLWAIKSAYRVRSLSYAHFSQIVLKYALNLAFRQPKQTGLATQLMLSSSTAPNILVLLVMIRIEDDLHNKYDSKYRGRCL